MSNNRKKYTEAQNVTLVSQVDQVCPLCAEPLSYKKRGKSYKNYEIAHIYPLNPTEEELKLLSEEQRLSDDVNDENNVIPLCKLCHGKFDKPRTIEGYRNLYKIKSQLIERYEQKNIWKRHTIESEISRVIEAIYNDPSLDESTEIEFSPKKVDEKLDDTISNPTRRKIKNYVQDYYLFIKDKFVALDQSETNLSEIISLQIKTYYLVQKKEGRSQQAIFDNIVSWIHVKTSPETNEAAEILASFFIQNCEIFE